MKPLDDLIDRARADPKRIVLAEGEDPRVVEAAGRAVREGIAKPILLGRASEIEAQAKAQDLVLSDVEIVDPDTTDRLESYAACLQELRRHRGMTIEQAREAARAPLYFANLMVRLGDAEGSVAGARYSTADTVRAAIQVIGAQEGFDLISSFFIMILCEPFHELKGAMVLADCGLVVDPNAHELAQIAMAAADNARDLLDLDPRVAMLSFSTKGSAKHPMIDKVNEAADKVQKLRPELKIEGEMQLDAAIVPEIGARKAPDSSLDGPANVLIFPDLQAGNIGYKMMERMGMAKAIGPILQGLAKPANDLSRGCNADDVYRVMAVTVAQAQAVAERTSKAS